MEASNKRQTSLKIKRLVYIPKKGANLSTDSFHLRRRAAEREKPPQRQPKNKRQKNEEKIQKHKETKTKLNKSR